MLRWLPCMLALAWCPLQASAEVTGAWRAQRSGDTPAGVLAQAEAGRLTAFDPGRLQRFVTKPKGSWIVLWPDPAAAPPQVVSLPWPTLARVSLYDANGLLRTTDVQGLDSGEPGYGRLALRLPAAHPAAAPILLQLRQSSLFPVPVTFRLQTLSDYRRSNAAWLSMASACFGVMLAMSMLALCFALMLRDATFAWYGGYVISYVLLQTMQSGFLYLPLGWGALVGDGVLAGIATILATLLFATLFMLRFCDIGRQMPHLRLVLLYVVGAVMALMLLRVVPIAAIQPVAQTAVNPLVAVWALLVLFAAACSAANGTRTAWFFLAGWAPLLGLVALAAAQSRGRVLAATDWLHDACLVAATLESIVLSIGLADRALSVRRERDSARLMADQDALTGLLNRRAWNEAARLRIADRGIRRQALLFLDLDQFKLLNDGYGHVAGDEALIALARALRDELQPDDLLGRYGGEEFVVLTGNTDMDAAVHLATRLCRRIDALHIAVDDDGLQLTASIGVARLRDGDSLASLVARADAAMYLAKASGRNQVVTESSLGDNAPGEVLS